MAIRIGVTADWHIPPAMSAGGPLNPETGLPIRYEDHILTIHNMLSEMKMARCDVAVFCGDLWAPVGNVADADQLNDLRDVLFVATEHFPIYALVGNHDGARAMAQRDAIAPLATQRGFRRLGGSGADRFDRGQEGINLAWVQYRSPEMYRASMGIAPGEQWSMVQDALRDEMHQAAAMAASINDAPTVLFLHQTILEAEVRAGQRMEGREFGVSIADLPDVNAVVSGHIHRPQVLNDVNPLVVYPGSPEIVDWGEADQEKSWGLLSVESSGSVTYETYPTHCRKWDDVHLTLEQARDSAAIQAAFSERPDGSRVRITVPVGQEERWGEDRKRLIKLVQDWGRPLDITVRQETIRDQNEHVSIVRSADTPWQNVVKAASEMGVQLPPNAAQVWEDATSRVAASDGAAVETGEPLRPVRIHVDGFTSLKDVEIPLSQIQMAVICGVNGAGKTSLAQEAPLWCLTGVVLRGQRANDHDAVLADDANTCVVEMDLESPANRYRVRRVYRKPGKTGTHTLTLSQWDVSLSDWQNISGNGVAETQQKLNHILGLGNDPAATLLRTVMVPQDAQARFASASPRERKDVLVNVLRLDWWDSVSAEIKDIRDKCRANIIDGEARLALLGLSANVGVAKRALTDLQEQIASLDAIATERKAAAENAAETYNAARDTLANAELVVSRRSAAMAQRDHAAAAMAELHARATTAALAIAQEETVPNRKQTIAELQERIASLSQDADGRIACAKMAVAQAENDLVSARLRQQNELQALSDLNSQAEAAWAAELATANAVLHNLEREHENAMRKADDDVNRLTSEWNAARTILADALARASALRKKANDVPCKGHMACPLLGAVPTDADVAALQERHDELSSSPPAELVAAEETKEQLGKVPDNVLDARLVVSDLENGKPVPAVGSPVLDEIENEIAAAKDQLAAARNALDAANADDAPRLKALADAQEELRVEQGRLDTTVRAVATAKADKVHALDDLERGLEAYHSAQVTLSDLPEQDVDALRETCLACEDEWKRTRESHVQAVSDLSVARGGIPAAENALVAAVDAAQAVSDLKIVVADAKASEDACNVLMVMAGPGGVPARLIDEALPALEASANAMLDRFSAGRMSLAVRTRGRNKSGDLIETLDVVIRVGDYERPYERLSGGERVRVDLSLAVGIAEMTKSRTGANLNWVVLDELCGPLDEEGRRVFADAVREIAQNVDLVQVISHLPDVQSMFEQRVEADGVGGWRLVA